MKMYKSNIIFGLISLLFFSFCGLFLDSTYRPSYTFGVPLALYMMFSGVLTPSLGLSYTWKRICSLLTHLSIIMPAGLFLKAATNGFRFFDPVADSGFFIFAASVVIFLIGLFRMRKA